jgi:RND family efflux transporter MFP subunit
MARLADAQAGVAAAAAALEQVRDLAETRSMTQIEAAEASLNAIQANLVKIRAGARDEERKQIEATVEQALANLTNVQADHGRMKDLFESGAVSRQTFDAVRTQLTVVQAQHDVAKQQWALIEKGARDEDILAVEAQVQQAEANLRLARQQVERQTWKQDVAIAEARLRQSDAGLEAASASVEARSWEAEIVAAHAMLKQARASRDLAQDALSDAHVTAPIAGIVSVRHQDAGSMAEPMKPLFEIVVMDIVVAVTSVLEEDVSRIRLGDPAVVSGKGIVGASHGRVSAISPIIDPRTRTAKVEVELGNADHSRKPGMFVRVRLQTDVRADAILVPRDVIVEDESLRARSVFVVRERRARRVPVTTCLADGNRVQITDGLASGDAVVYAGQAQLSDGDTVRIVRVLP